MKEKPLSSHAIDQMLERFMKALSETTATPVRASTSEKLDPRFIEPMSSDDPELKRKIEYLRSTSQAVD